MKKLRIRRRTQAPEGSPLELALAPAVRDGRWRVPDRFNFTRDVVEVLGRDVKRRALTFVGADGIIEPRTFRELADGANRWASILRDRELRPGDRVLVLSAATVDWVELVLGCIKAGVVVVPSAPHLGAVALESRYTATGASLLVATDDAKSEIARMTFEPPVHHLLEGRRRRASDHVDEEPTAETSARDIAFVAWSSGTSGPPKPAAHTHGATFAVRGAAEHWLGAGPGDVVWSTASAESLPAFSTSMFGAWARGAEIAIHDGRFEPVEHLELLHRFDVTIVCQPPSEYRALAGRRELARYRSRRLRRLVSTGDYLDPDVIGAFEEAWGTTIRNGYGQTETGILVAHGPENDAPSESLGRALPGYHVAVVDDSGSELPHGVEGYLAVRDRPPTMFAGYLDVSGEPRDPFRGDWYLTGDVAVADEDGTYWFVSRAEDTISIRGRTFGPHEVERVLRGHDVVADTAVVGIRDLERGGHFLRAFVVLTPGVDGSQQLEAELRHSLGQSLHDQQVPREIEFIEDLPTAPSGAVKRGELRDRPAAGRPLWEEPAPPEDVPASELKQKTAPEPTALRPLEPHWAHPVEPDPVAVAPPEPRLAVPAPPEDEAPADVRLPVEAFVEPVPVEPVPVEPIPVEPIPVEPIQVDPIPVEPSQVDPVYEPVPEAVVEPPPVVPEPLREDVSEAPPEPVPSAAVEPEVIEPQVIEPEMIEPEPVEPEMIEPEPVEPEMIEPEPVEPEMIEPEPVEAAHAVEAEAAASVVELVPARDATVDPASEPLPDFVVLPGADESRGAPPPPAPSPLDEDEEDLGPLPEYVVDPERRLEPVASAPAPAPDEPTVPSPDDLSTPAFPSVPALDLKATLAARRDSAEPGPSAATPPRQRPARTVPLAKAASSDAEPGDEAEETTWMRGLSSRLSAYSLDESGEATPDAGDPHRAAEEAGDEAGEKESD